MLARLRGKRNGPRVIPGGRAGLLAYHPSDLGGWITRASPARGLVGGVYGVGESYGGGFSLSSWRSIARRFDWHPNWYQLHVGRRDSSRRFTPLRISSSARALSCSDR